MRKIYGFIVLAFLFSCNENSVVSVNNLKTYKVKKQSASFLQWDEFVKDVETIKLETTENGLIGQFTKGIINNSNIYILDYKLKKIVNFDIDGNFLGNIGTQGNGPGEYIELRDFCVSRNSIYLLDYGKIHCYNSDSRDFLESWSLNNESDFNPSHFLVYDKKHYFLWCCKPDAWDKNKKESFRLREVRNGSVRNQYFKYYLPTSGDNRFFNNGSINYIAPIDGENIIYRLINDSIEAAFEIDFGKHAISAERIDELRKSKTRNAYFEDNSFKCISNILETQKYIFFDCVGPEAKTYECMINKETADIKFGLRDYKRAPHFFFTDGEFLYGYYEPYTLIKQQKMEVDLNTCFNSVFDGATDIDISDNIIIVKVALN